ncbi:hypothetical protein D3870_09825 [Noviherbaspirillum cavernae]|uniref:Uncharacterized protein n=1 Tax=Noviherbaspirillum cavernae TaxID=2320862 RepID=A0A418X1F0_9BURK|nr:hypothetical protein [Noviherbaspirillum cavernae]RJG06271.1 hypothetical protein D3870_09825 [Noviherbaspirillum cavernae]
MKAAIRHDHVHRCVMVYPDGMRLTEPRRTANLRIWILSNRTFHPTAALFVDGKCRYRGHLSDEAIHQLEGEFK